jgi:hypothetical protein
MIAIAPSHINSKEAARYCGVTPRTIQDWCRYPETHQSHLRHRRLPGGHIATTYEWCDELLGKQKRRKRPNL